MSRTLLIDGDALAWSVAFRPRTSAREAARRVDVLLAELKADRAVVAFGDGSRRYFRHDLFPAYKPNRSPHPPGFADAAAALGERFEVRRGAGLEADDVLGILATTPAMACERVIVACDKDLLSVPGLHFDFTKGRAGEVDEIDPHEADWRHMLQTLTGDGTDGYGGARGIGPVRARAMLSSDDAAEWWPAVLGAFNGAGQSEADALLQARLARVHRATDYDLTAGEVRLWQPTAAAAAEVTS